MGTFGKVLISIYCLVFGVLKEVKIQNLFGGGPLLKKKC
jgi:hypothetical protein